MTVDQVIKDAANAAAEKALLQGEYNKKKKTVIRMLKHGEFSDDLICEMTGASADELENIKKEIS